MTASTYNLGDLNLRHLLVVQAISEEGSFSLAAERMGCSQAALSQQLAAIEEILGSRLIERARGKRRIGTTDAGRLLLVHAKTVIERLQALHADLEAFGQGKVGTIRVGTFESAGAIIVPPLLRRLRQQWPRIEIQLTEMQRDDELLGLLESGEIDISFSVLPLPNGPLASVHLLDDPYVLVASPDLFPTQVNSPISLAQIGNTPLATFGDSRSVEHVESLMSARGIQLNVVFRSNYNAMVQSLADGGSVAALSSLMTTDLTSLTTSKPYALHEVPPRQIGLAWHRDREPTKSVRAFIETARSICAKLGEDYAAKMAQL